MIVGGEKVARFVSEQLGFGLCPPYAAMGIERDGVIIAGALLNQFEGPDVHLTMAGKGWTKGFLQELGEYIFGQLGCLRFSTVTEQPKVADYVCRMGGKVEGVIRNHFGKGRDGIFVGVLSEEWRYVKK